MDDTDDEGGNSIQANSIHDRLLTRRATPSSNRIIPFLIPLVSVNPMVDLATLNRLLNEPEWKYMQPFKSGGPL